MPPLPPRACVECGSTYQPRAANQTMCRSAECRRAYGTRWKRDRRPPPTERPPVPCVVCGRPFAPDRKTANTCPAPECRAQRKRDLAAARSRGETRGAEPRACVVCGTEFHGHERTLTCGRGCWLARNRENSRRRLGVGDYRCVVCDTEIVDLGPHGRNRYTCSDVCRVIAVRQRADRVYRAHPEYRERMVVARRTKKQTDPAYAARIRDRDAARTPAGTAAQLERAAAELARRSATPQEPRP